MPGPSHRGDLPPDVPSSVPGEYADAYRAAYQRAMQDLEDTPAEVPEGVAAPPASGAASSPVSSTVSYGGPGRQPGTPAPGGGLHATEYRAWPRWFVPVVMAAVALLFIGCAYVLGRMVSGAPEGSTASSASASPSVDGPPTAQSPTAGSKPAPQPWKGRVQPVEPVKVTSACRAPDGVDAAGNKVSYRPSLMADGKTDTAWRCKGKAIGERITIHLPAGTKLAEVGLIPGYAKTDPRTGVDRYAENNRITRVTWFLADGSQIGQSLSGDPNDRSMRTVRVPATTGDRLVLRVDEVAKGSRDTTMISELRVAEASE